MKRYYLVQNNLLWIGTNREEHEDIVKKDYDIDRLKDELEAHRLQELAKGYEIASQTTTSLSMKKEVSLWDTTQSITKTWTILEVVDESWDFSSEGTVLIRDIFGETLGRLKGEVKIKAMMGEDGMANDMLEIINTCQRREGCPEFRDVRQFFRCKSNSWAEIIEEDDEEEE